MALLSDLLSMALVSILSIPLFAPFRFCVSRDDQCMFRIENYFLGFIRRI